MNLSVIQRLPSRQRMQDGAVLGLVGVGGLALLAIILEFLPLHVGRYALILQLIALLVGLITTRRWTQRLVLYPLFMAGMLYLWDTTLPPPDLPEGLFRHILGRVFLIGLLADFFSTWLRKEKPLVTRGNFIRLASVAHVLHTNPQALRKELNQAGRIVVVQFDGEAYILFEDFGFLLEKRALD